MITRKGSQVDISDFAKRILIDSNVRFVNFSTFNVGKVNGTTIIKSHGKYYIIHWHNEERGENNYWYACHERCVTRDDIVEKLIKELHAKCDKFSLLDKHLNHVHWEITYGDLPEGFEKLEDIPEEIEV